MFITKNALLFCVFLLSRSSRSAWIEIPSGVTTGPFYAENKKLRKRDFLLKASFVTHFTLSTIFYPQRRRAFYNKKALQKHYD